MEDPYKGPRPIRELFFTLLVMVIVAIVLSLAAHPSVAKWLLASGSQP
jgi:hypothetical protein